MNFALPGIVTWGGVHPAHAIKFDILQQMLNDSPNIKSRELDEHLTIYKYNARQNVSDTWGLVESVARGLVLDRTAKHIAATPFPKFFNHDQIVDTIKDVMDKPVVVREKLDGSLIITFCNRGKWWAVTQLGVSLVARMADKYITHHGLLAELDPTQTYLWEFVTPEHPIVIMPECPALYLLGISSMTGHFYQNSVVDATASRLSAYGVVSVPTERYETLSELIEEITKYEDSNLISTREGVIAQVVGKDDATLMVKIKSDRYRYNHKHHLWVKPKTILDDIKERWSVSDTVTYSSAFSEVHPVRQRFWEERLGNLQEDYDRISEAVRDLHGQVEKEENAQAAITIRQICADYQSAVFAMRNDKPTHHLIVGLVCIEKLKELSPDG